MAHMPPMQKPTRTRAASIQPQLGASAEAILAIASRPSNPHRILRRSMPPDAITTSVANNAASSAGREIISPAVPVDVSRASAIGVRRPTGSISVVTTEKVARPTAVTASQGCRTVLSTAADDDVLMTKILETTNADVPP
ncbi:hypothetical protein D3C73_1321370 [compost metagenome]